MPRGKKVPQELQDKVNNAFAALLNKGWSQSQIAKHFNINQSTVSAILRGRDKPGEITVKKVLGVKVEAAAVKKPSRDRRAAGKLPPEPRVRHRKRLAPGHDTSGELRDKSLHDRPGDLLCLPGRGRTQHDVLEKRKEVTDPDVFPLSKTKLVELDLQNRARLLAGLNQIKVKIFACLRCRDKFESTGDRMCHQCKGGEVPIMSGRIII